MSRVDVETILVGEANTVTKPNNTLTNLAAGTALVNGDNVRLEGIDRRNIQVPNAGFVNLTDAESGTWEDSTPALTSLTWTPVPTHASGSAPSTLEVYVDHQQFAMVRFSFAVRIDGYNSQGTSGSGKQPVLYTRLTYDGVAIPPTERAWQAQVITLGAAPPTNPHECAVRQATMIVYSDPIGGSGLRTYQLEYKVDRDGNGVTPLPVIQILDMKSSSVVYRKY